MNIKEAVREYNQIRVNEKLLADRKKYLADFIKKHAIKNGVKDQNGSHYLEDEQFKFGDMVKKTITLNFDRAKEFLVGKKLWKEVVEVTETINEDKLSLLIDSGVLKEEEIEPLCDVKETHSVVVTEKKIEEEIVEVQPIAASRAKSHFLRGR